MPAVNIDNEWVLVEKSESDFRAKGKSLPSTALIVRTLEKHPLQFASLPLLYNEKDEINALVTALKAKAAFDLAKDNFAIPCIIKEKEEKLHIASAHHKSTLKDRKQIQDIDDAKSETTKKALQILKPYSLSSFIKSIHIAPTTRGHSDSITPPAPTSRRATLGSHAF